MKFAFLIQGEGRGHMTQAITLREMLISEGHEVVAILVGTSVQRKIPDFFYDKIYLPVITFESPNFIIDKEGKGILILKSLWFNIKRWRIYFKSMHTIDEVLKNSDTEIVINFYELLGGLYFKKYKPSYKHICIGHQLLVLHPSFDLPKGKLFDSFFLKLNTKLTCLRADKLLALSFRPLADYDKKRLVVVPPLLRSEIFTIKAHNRNYLLAYILNEGYKKELLDWHIRNPQHELHYFSDIRDNVSERQIAPNLIWHSLDDVSFLNYMAGCKAYATSAGFESICEAMYMQKPIMTVPTKGHYEQVTNSFDASLTGRAIPSTSFELDHLLAFIESYPHTNSEYQKWAQNAKFIIINHLTL